MSSSASSDSKHSAMASALEASDVVFFAPADPTDSAESGPSEKSDRFPLSDRHSVALQHPFRFPDHTCDWKPTMPLNRSLSVLSPSSDTTPLSDSTPLTPRRFSAIHAGTLRFPLHVSTPVAPRDTARGFEMLLGSSCDETSSDSDTNVIPPRKPAGSCSSTTSDRKGSRPPTIDEDDTWNQGVPASSPQFRKDGQPKRLSRSGSSVNCSTTASISARSTCSSLSKPFRSFVIEDCGASSKSGGGSTARLIEGGRLEGCRIPSTDVTSMTPSSSFRKHRCPLGGSMGSLSGGVIGGDEDESWVATPLKTARESAAGREARRSSLGIGTAGTGGCGLSSSISKQLLAAPPIKIAEAKNDELGRLLRVSQKSVVGSQGVVSMQTRIEVFDIDSPNPIPIFAVRHCDSSLWGRQMKVHKNILLAARLAGVDVPNDLEIPFDSKKMFEQTDNIQHMHGYLEKTVPHIKLGNRPGNLRLFWWRAIGNGVAVLQNLDSGKLLLLKNPDRTIPSALDCVLKILNSPKLLSPSFHEPDPGYATAEMVEKELESRGSEVIDVADVEPLVTRLWGEQENVSPVTTQLIVRVNASRFLRYSVGTDRNDPRTLLMQVHLNEPFSRGTNAYPVCMAAVPIESLKLSAIRLGFKRSVWFLRKLHEVHLDMQQLHPSSSTNTSGPWVTSGSPCTSWASQPPGSANMAGDGRHLGSANMAGDGRHLSPLTPEKPTESSFSSRHPPCKKNSITSQDSPGGELQKGLDDSIAADEPRPLLAKQLDGTPRVRSKCVQGFRSGSAQRAKCRASAIACAGRSGFGSSALLTTSVPEDAVASPFGVTSPPRTRQSKAPLTSREERFHFQPKTPVPARRELKEAVGFRSSTTASTRRSAAQPYAGRGHPTPEATPRCRGNMPSCASASRQFHNGVGQVCSRKSEMSEPQSRCSSPWSVGGSGERCRDSKAGLRGQVSPQTLIHISRDSSPGSGSRSGGVSGGIGKHGTHLAARRAASPKLGDGGISKTTRVGIRIRGGNGVCAPSFAQPVRRRFSLSPAKAPEATSDSGSS